MNRKFLARAVKLGFSEVHLYTPKVPVMCRDDHRRYVRALLNPEAASQAVEGGDRDRDPGIYRLLDLHFRKMHR